MRKIYLLGFIYLMCALAVEADETVRLHDKESIVVSAALPRRKNENRQKRQFGNGLTYEYLTSPTCLTRTGLLGRCLTFEQCYLYFKMPSALAHYETLMMSTQDSCSYVNPSGKQDTGVCCNDFRYEASNPFPVFSSYRPGDFEQALSPDNTFSNNWPPPLPTHPPNHAAPTHPPVSTSKWPPPLPTHPSTYPPSSTWPPATKPPTSKPQWPPSSKPTWPPASSPSWPPSSKPPSGWPPASQPTWPPTSQPSWPPTSQPSWPPASPPSWPPASPPSWPPASSPSWPPTSKPPTWPPTSKPTHPTKPEWPATKPPGTYPTTPADAEDFPININECGIKNGYQDQERIVGGQDAEPGEWPWMVAILTSGRLFCGGSLIDDTHILTAAHCVAHMNPWDVARLRVHLGDYDIKSKGELKHAERKVKKVVRHRGFDPQTLYNDIALLTLDSPVSFSKNIRPICLPQGKIGYSGRTATVIGWGSLREMGPTPGKLQEVNIPIWTNLECKSKYGPAAPGGIVDSFLCAGKASKDSCSGDSGGPLMIHEGKWQQIGIVSWGIGCGKGQFPGVYTRLSSFTNWINKNLNV